MEKVKCLIIGSGPAGYTAAIYASRADLHPVVYQGLQAGGQLTITTEVENFPGYPKGVDGKVMMKDMEDQAKRFGADIRFGIVTDVDLLKRPFTVKADDGKTIMAETVIIATGASARWLGLESEKKYIGQGVSACATCDGFFYKNQDVAVIGGGDTALEDALFLTNVCNKVYLVHRRNELRASKAMQKRVFDNDKIEIIWDSIPKEVLGDFSGVNGALLTNVKTKEERKIDITGFFVAIGHKPNTDLFKGVIDLDEKGYIKTQPDSTKTNIEGVFAAGDVQDSVFRQAVVAAGSGCMAAIEAERFIASQKK
ncbi:MAG: thioredoxin-disulfide reductase [Bacteroidales bacterium]|nr:thioredoxin-disulfide reductase [Bacteroidales bacterium]